MSKCSSGRLITFVEVCWRTDWGVWCGVVRLGGQGAKKYTDRGRLNGITINSITTNDISVNSITVNYIIINSITIQLYLLDDPEVTKME